MLKSGALLCIIMFAFSTLFSQEEVYEEVKNTEVSIPSAPAFAMLGVNPELVMRPADLRSFKVDWRIKNYNLEQDYFLTESETTEIYIATGSLEATCIKRGNLDIK
jgi:hypothetical protein